MTTTPEHAARIVDGRKVVDELPYRVGVLPGEIDLVAQHLLDAVETLLGSEPYTSSGPRRIVCDREDQPEDRATTKEKEKRT